MKVLGNSVGFVRRSLSSGEHRLERIFLELRKQWYPHSEQGEYKPADHHDMLQNLLERLRKDDQLSYLDSQLYPNLQRIADKKFPSKGFRHHKDDEVEASLLHTPNSRVEMRSGFYYCKQLIQFMQQVFHDCRLDTEYSAPSNRGWMNLFRRWSLSPMVRFTWAMTAGTYSARFQSFCEFQLLLDSGTPSYDKALHLSVHVDAKVQHLVNITLRDSETTNWDVEARHHGLNPYECRLVEAFISAYVHLDRVNLIRPELKFEVFPLKIAVDDAFSHDDTKGLQLNGGFLVVAPHPDNPRAERAVVYFRIRSSMRNMDLARKAFIRLKKDYHLSHIPLCLVDNLPDIAPPEFRNALQRRAYHEVHKIDRENMERCRWFSQLVQEINITKPEPDHTRR
jgi:hypothetical protein